MNGRRVLGTLIILASVAGCGAVPSGDAAVRVVATTEILADLVRAVGGDRVTVDSVVPPGGDPHSYEPTPSDAKTIAKADVTFTNHLLLEEHALIKAIDANAPKDAPNVSLAESAEAYGAQVIPLVENIALDVPWVGLAVRGSGAARGASRASEIRLTAAQLDGPGRLAVYLTHALGQPEVYVDSADGLSPADTVVLPPDAHTHVNWAFSTPGIYRLALSAALSNPDGVVQPVAAGTFTFAVGVDPHTVAGGATVLDRGHTDVAVDLDRGDMYAWTDADTPGTQRAVPAADVVIDVPNRALDTVPDDPRFAFLGRAGQSIHQLPQAVLGKHVHGEIDPHLWQNVANAKAYVQIIRDTLVTRDPAGADGYRRRTAGYLAELDRLDHDVRARIATIPADRRQLVTTHDGFGYLAKAYGLTVAGFVVPNPAQEPSAAQVRKLTETIANLRVPAVFMEPNLSKRASVLTQIAKDQDIRICKLYGDAFDDQAGTYPVMMRHNADELATCLGGP
ncbi:anchored repeat ABC transporter, substrate-binding protein [Dactylosporangium sp. CA-152071]|uniref:anchored repeat ABC transporter, substrate-binding protein n=1 Tax=Dactylosporangium sp. CA-152071 TaxID=3239933 RepID=UPI003D8AB6BA